MSANQSTRQNAKSQRREQHGCARHGKVTPEYRAWQGMKKRCTDSGCDAFPYYGGRGVKVCEAWVKSFAAFLRDVGERPSPKHTLDRHPNSDGNYEPGNVRWVTMAVQNRNKSNNRNLTHDGVTMCLRDWARRLGIDEATLRKRLRKWNVERALSTKVDPKKRNRRCRTV
jgi:hypothetical protein